MLPGNNFGRAGLSLYPVLRGRRCGSVKATSGCAPPGPVAIGHSACAQVPPLARADETHRGYGPLCPVTSRTAAGSYSRELKATKGPFRSIEEGTENRKLKPANVAPEEIRA
jgi:hypothetical protein